MDSGSEQKSPEKEHVYRSESIAVYWNASRCIHSGNCVRGLPQVFQSSERPWIKVGQATANEIAEVVSHCPSGALHFERFDGGPQEQAAEVTTVEPRPNGPLAVRGHLRVVAADGTVLREDTRMTLCRCGQSNNKPFCDGSHRRVGFTAE